MQIERKKTKFKKKSTILIALFFILVLTLFGLFFTLYRGIHIENLHFSNITLQGLYLKLDNKFIFTLDKLKISPSKSSSNFDFQKSLRWFQKSLSAMSYFKQVEIRDIVLPDTQHASIFYDGKRYELLFPSVVAQFQITPQEGEISLHIQQLHLEKYKINAIGKFVFSTTKHHLTFNIVANSLEKGMKSQEKLVVKGSSDLKTLNLSAFSTTLQSLDPFKEKIKELNTTLYEWLFEKSSFNDIRITNLFFSAPFNEDFVDKLLKSLYAEVTLKNVALNLEKNLPPITASNLTVKFKNDTLTFLLDQPQYEKIKLDGSKVELKNFGGNLKTIVSLKSKEAFLDERLHHLLQTYDINFDIHQKKSTIDVDLRLTFEEKEDDFDVEVKGILKSKDSEFDFFGFPILAKDLNVVLNITPTQKHLFVNDSKLSFNQPKFLGLINCDIDLDSKKASGKINPDYIRIASKESSKSPFENFLEIQGDEIQQIYFDVDFNNTPILNFKDLQAQITLAPTKRILLSDISKFYAYSKLLQYLDVRNGEIAIQTEDFQTLYIQTLIANLQYPFFDKKWNPIKEFHSTIKVTPKQIHLASLDESIVLDYQNSILKANISNKNLDLMSLRNSKIPLFKTLFHSFDSTNQPQKTPQKQTKEKSQNTQPQATQQTQTNQKIQPDKQIKQTQATQQSGVTKQKNDFRFYLEAKNSTLRYKKWMIPTDEIIINANGDNIKMDFTHKNGVTNLDFYDNVIKFQANNFSGNFINLLAGKTIVEGGLFSAKGLYKNKILKGEVEMQNTVFKNFATLQNVIALIDTIPSLIVFKKPGLGADGYEVSQGRITFDLNDEYLGLRKIDLIGSSIDVVGSGIIKLEDESIDIALNISTIKGLSEVLSKIPIVGYLLLGKEGKISTGVVIKGTLDEPTSDVSIAEDLISAPFKIIQRIFTGE